MLLVHVVFGDSMLEHRMQPAQRLAVGMSETCFGAFDSRADFLVAMQAGSCAANVPSEASLPAKQPLESFAWTN